MNRVRAAAAALGELLVGVAAEKSGVAMSMGKETEVLRVGPEVKSTAAAGASAALEAVLEVQAVQIAVVLLLLVVMMVVVMVVLLLLLLVVVVVVLVAC
jgi:hypothetical protein